MTSKIRVALEYIILIPLKKEREINRAAKFCQLDTRQFLEMAIREKLEEIEAAMGETE